jgi:hypothetical protein
MLNLDLHPESQALEGIIPISTETKQLYSNVLSFQVPLCHQGVHD